ncbi:hypothetical protein APY03_5829 [Variovorax sp. WDL1]|nr:hypothetical protein APY03_5829 [Variovorax sp. WDL1]
MQQQYGVCEQAGGHGREGRTGAAFRQRRARMAAGAAWAGPNL